MHHLGRWGVKVAGLVLSVATVAACASRTPAQGAPNTAPPVRPGMTVLLEDSLQVIAGRRIALITNHTTVDASGTHLIDVLQKDPRVKRANVTLVRLFSPEHGIRGDVDRENLPDQLDERSGLMVHSLYTNGTVPPPDSLLRDLDALVFDLQDLGPRTWTGVGVLVSGLRAAARAGIPFVVLDRPNPITGRMEAPLLESALSNPEDPTPTRRGLAFALYPAPLRHGMTNGELARWFAAELRIPVQLTVVPMQGWRRTMWWDETGLPWVVPSPAMATVASALVYPALVPLEGTNVSVGRGTKAPFQRFGAPWMDAPRLATMLNELGFVGVRFEAERFTPRESPDRKFNDREIPGVKIVVTDRDRAPMGRVGAAVLWSLKKVHGDSLRATERTIDQRFGSSAARQALFAGTDPDEVIDAMQPAVAAFQRKVRPYLLY
ncbi:MAG: exo-beta-N-acetylmuramidase NamZ domain-containing protein [Gemmatimonadota bacterium]